MSERDAIWHGRPSDQNQGQAAGEDRLAVELAHLARVLQQQEPDELLEAMVRAAVDMIPGVEDASLSIVFGRKTITSQAPTSELPARVDALQMATGEGPCLSAAYEETTVRISDMDTETRWPEFSRRAADETDVQSMLAFQLFVEDDNLGALNLYARTPGAFDDESEHVGLLVATHLSVALAESRQASQLHEAIVTRDVIGQAKGILMERHKITDEQAFLLLSEASSRTNTKLTAVAEQVTTSGELRSEEI